MILLKKYLVFISSFAGLYIAFQILSGWILTAFYTPDIQSKIGSQTTAFGETSSLSLFVTLLIATLAYSLSGKLRR